MSYSRTARTMMIAAAIVDTGVPCARLFPLMPENYARKVLYFIQKLA